MGCFCPQTRERRVFPSGRERAATSKKTDMIQEDIDVGIQRSGSIRAKGRQVGRQVQERRLVQVKCPKPLLNFRVPNGIEAEQVAAGWPSWLASIAGEAIRGWVPRRAQSFKRLEKIGQGTFSNVYRALDLENGRTVALKKVQVKKLEPRSILFMAREILILRRLEHPNIVKLEGLVTSKESCTLYLIFDYMDHDLAKLASDGVKFTEPQVKCCMQQLLCGLDHCHSHGIVHRDIKTSNLLIDNNGILKIADFGLATVFDPEQQYPLTSCVVTLWYRPPEILLGATYYDFAVDLWSSGCVLGELFTGKPIIAGKTEVDQLHKIFKLCGCPSNDYWEKSKLPHAEILRPTHPYKRCISETFKGFSPSALALLEVFLSIDPADRGTAALALKNEFFIAKPHACDPSSFPKYLPRRAFKSEVREKDRSQRNAGRKVPQLEEAGVAASATPSPDSNKELPSPMRIKQNQEDLRITSEILNSRLVEFVSGFQIKPSASSPEGGAQHHHSNKLECHSGPSIKQTSSPILAPKIYLEADLSPLSSFVAIRKHASVANRKLLEPGNKPLDSNLKHELVCPLKKEVESSRITDPNTVFSTSLPP